MTTQRMFEPHEFAPYAEANQICCHCDRGQFASIHEQPRPEQGSGEATKADVWALCARGEHDYCAGQAQLTRTGPPSKCACDCHKTVEHDDASAAPERGEQSQLFPRYSFAVVTGRYKILDNRADRTPVFPQIATADGEDEARLIVGALNAAEQHSTLVAQRDRMAEALRACRADLSAAIDRLPPRLHDHEDMARCKTLLKQIDDALMLTTIEQEGTQQC